MFVCRSNGRGGKKEGCVLFVCLFVCLSETTKKRKVVSSLAGLLDGREERIQCDVIKSESLS